MLKGKLNGSVAACTVLLALGGCGSDNKTYYPPSDDTTTSVGTEVTVVDPYIQDAVMYVDANDNGIYDEGEQVSTPTGDKGVCTFDPALESGAVIRMKSKGVHNGVPFNGSLTADFTGTGIVSPLTTLLEKFGGDSTAVISLLSNAGITLTEGDLNADPMQGLDSSSSDEDLSKLQASVAINSFLEIIGTSSDETDIAAASAQLATVVTVTKNIINTVQIAGDFDAGVNSAIAVANYAVERVANGDTTVLTDLSDSNTADTLMDVLIVSYTNDPSTNYKLDTSVEVANIDSTSIDEAKSMTAQQFFDFSGEMLNVEYSGITSHNYDAHWMWYENINFGATSLTYDWTDFGWDWDDEDSDGIQNEHLTAWASGSGTLSGETWTIQEQGIEFDGSIIDATVIMKRVTDGSVEVETNTFTQDGITETDTSRTIFISAEKVTEVAGIAVGAIDRDVYKVKFKEQYGQLDGTSFVASGNGYNPIHEWNCGISEFTEASIINDPHSMGFSEGNANLIARANGEVFNIDTNSTVTDAYWTIKTTDTANDTLSIRAYDDFDLKATNGVCNTNWIGDLSFAFAGVTKIEAQAIARVLDEELHNSPIIGTSAEGLTIH